MEASEPVGVKRMTIGLPNHVNAASTSPDSNGRRMSRLVSIVARTGGYPLRDRQILFLVRLSLKIASRSEDSIFVFEFVSFYYFQSEKQTLSLSGARTRRAHCTFINEAYPLRPKS
jgi:hypothetical protein